MKKVLILLLLVFLTAGCLNVKEAQVSDIIYAVQNSSSNLTNQSRNGYRYFLPLGMQVESVNDHNEIITSGKFRFFLYVDFVSLYNQVEFQYEISSNSYISKDISFNGVPGYLEVNVKEGQYLIEIMFNYAKIEVIVDRDFLNEAITKSLIILSSIRFNEAIVTNMMGSNVLNYREEVLNIFETNRGESNFLDVYEDHGHNENREIPDLDRIN